MCKGSRQGFRDYAEPHTADDNRQSTRHYAKKAEAAKLVGEQEGAMAQGCPGTRVGFLFFSRGKAAETKLRLERAEAAEWAECHLSMGMTLGQCNRPRRQKLHSLHRRRRELWLS